MAYFTDFLNKHFAPEGQEWQYSQQQVAGDDGWADIMNLGGGQPTYTLGPARDELTSAPPSVYNRPDPREMGPKMGPVAVADDPNALYALAPLAAAVPAAEAMRRQRGRNQAAADKKAQAERVKAAKQQRAASQLRGGASSAASASDYADRRYGGRTRMPTPIGASPVLEGEFIPRSSQVGPVSTRPALARPPIEGTVVRRGPGMLTKGGTALSLVGLPFLASAYESEGATPREAYGTALAETLMGLAAGPSNQLGGGMDVPVYGDAYAPGFGMVAPQRPMLSDQIRPQTFDTVNDLLINQYLEGIDPYAQLLYSRNIGGF